MGWVVAILFSLLSIPIQAVAILTGLLILALFATNIIGFLAGAITLATEERTMLTWMGFGFHGIQFIVATGIILLGMLFG